MTKEQALQSASDFEILQELMKRKKLVSVGHVGLWASGKADFRLDFQKDFSENTGFLSVTYGENNLVNLQIVKQYVKDNNVKIN